MAQGNLISSFVEYHQTEVYSSVETLLWEYCQLIAMPYFALTGQTLKNGTKWIHLAGIIPAQEQQKQESSIVCDKKSALLTFKSVREPDSRADCTCSVLLKNSQKGFNTSAKLALLTRVLRDFYQIIQTKLLSYTTGLQSL